MELSLGVVMANTKVQKQTDRFVGEFAGDFPKGEGIYYHADGRIEEGHWDGFELVQEKKISKQKPQ